MSKKMGIASIETVKDANVSGYHLECTQFDVIRSLKMMAVVAPIVMPMIGQFAQFMEPDGDGGVTLMDLDKIDTTKLALPLASIFSSIGPDKIVKLARDLLEDTQAMTHDEKGQSILRQLNTESDIINVFGSDLKGMLMAMGFSLKVNFASFFSGSGTGAKKPATAAKR